MLYTKITISISYVESGDSVFPFTGKASDGMLVTKMTQVLFNAQRGRFFFISGTSFDSWKVLAEAKSTYRRNGSYLLLRNWIMPSEDKLAVSSSWLHLTTNSPGHLHPWGESAKRAFILSGSWNRANYLNVILPSLQYPLLSHSMFPPRWIWLQLAVPHLNPCVANVKSNSLSLKIWDMPHPYL